MNHFIVAFWSHKYVSVRAGYNNMWKYCVQYKSVGIYSSNTIVQSMNFYAVDRHDLRHQDYHVPVLQVYVDKALAYRAEYDKEMKAWNTKMKRTGHKDLVTDAVTRKVSSGIVTKLLSKNNLFICNS